MFFLYFCVNLAKKTHTFKTLPWLVFPTTKYPEILAQGDWYLQLKWQCFVKQRTVWRNKEETAVWWTYPPSSSFQSTIYEKVRSTGKAYKTSTLFSSGFSCILWGISWKTIEKCKKQHNLWKTFQTYLIIVTLEAFSR